MPKNFTSSDKFRSSSRFSKIREAHQTELAEDYVEMIFDLIEHKGEARVVDLARRFGVSSATVNATIQRLKKEDLVNAEPHRSIFLTSKGNKLANSSLKRHDIVFRFLLSLGISEETALTDAEGIEHHVSQETLQTFKKLIS
tara:strand:+ start:538 stop:963 length:426 start_codon:yes stop_codon:yes gene_type:complete